MVDKTAAPALGKQSYSDKLRDPRWQRKRLEILQRDDYTCHHCRSDKNTLNVHHCFYTKSRDTAPWEYPSASLVTLCEECHEGEKQRAQEGGDFLVRNLAMKGATSFEYCIIEGLLRHFPGTALDLAKWLAEKLPSDTESSRFRANKMLEYHSSKSRLDPEEFNVLHPRSPEDDISIARALS